LDHEREGDEAGDGEIFENCIEKNFHVSNMKAASSFFNLK